MIGHRDSQERRWYVRSGNHVDGPHPESRIRAWRREGRLDDDILLSRDGRTWHRVRWGRRRRPSGTGTAL